MTTRHPLSEHIPFTGSAMAGINVGEILQSHRLVERGW